MQSSFCVAWAKGVLRDFLFLFSSRENKDCFFFYELQKAVKDSHVLGHMLDEGSYVTFSLLMFITSPHILMDTV